MSKEGTQRGMARGPWMVAGMVVVCGAVGTSLMASRHEPLLRAETRVGNVPVGGLTRTEAAHRIRTWWETARRKTIAPYAPGLTKPLEPTNLTGLGLRLDDVRTIAVLPTEGFWEGIGRRVGISRPEPVTVFPLLTFDPKVLGHWKSQVAARVPTPRPARVVFQNGQIVRQSETTRQELDVDRFPDFALAAAVDEAVPPIPLRAAPKRVSDAQLAGIRDVVAQYSTRFSSAQRDRVVNIRVASGFLDGLVLLPGESLSFNDTVGERTQARGFRIAGVYRNGRHDFDFGGGICQVSTTLYNAALLSDLGIVKRSNHSMPVPYAPLGRDAAVSFGSLDLKIQNTTDQPVAISRSVSSTRITFYVLGQRVPGRTIRIEQGKLTSWPQQEKQVVDPNLAPGARRVVEKGGARRRLTTTRVVLLNGVEVRRETLGTSHYRGGARIVALAPTEAPPDAPHVSTVILERP